MEHGKVSEKNFLKILPDAIDDFMDFMKMAVCLNITNGTNFATATVDGTNLGVLGVDRIERFNIGQKVGLKSSSVALAYYYVTAINVDTSKITASATRGGAVADISAYVVADTTKCYMDGAYASSMTSMKSSLLSAVNGGSTSLYGQTKTAYPYLQAINVSGSSITSSNLLGSIFDAFTTIRNKGKGNPLTVLMSYKHLGTAMKQLESSKGAFHVVPDSTKVTAYGWSEIQVMSVKGVLTFVGIQEIDDDFICFVDWKSWKFHSNGFFRKRQSPDGKEYFEIRSTSGYQYVVDLCCFGDLVLSRPSYCGIIYGISY